VLNLREGLSPVMLKGNGTVVCLTVTGTVTSHSTEDLNGQNISFRLHDIFGKPVKAKMESSNKINISSLPGGFYIVVMDVSGSVFTEKLVVE
jgi:hypothetical protein